MTYKKTKKKLTTGHFILIGALVAAFTIPVFRSGLKSHLTFAQFIFNHTIFAQPGPEFIPREDYDQIFSQEGS